MSQSSFEEPDLERWARLLQEYEVFFVLVGGAGAQLHGATRPTLDIDVVPQWTEGNLERLCVLLRSINAESTSGLHAAGDDITPTLLTEREITTWRTDIGRIDVLLGIPDDEGMPVEFEDLTSRSSRASIAGIQITVAGLDDIITSKRHANRAKDRAALPELERLREARLQRDHDLVGDTPTSLE